MSPKKSPSVKSEVEMFPSSEEALERPSTLAKRDLIVEFNGDQKTTIRTTDLYTKGGAAGDRSEHTNLCQVHEEIPKGKTGAVVFLKPNKFDCKVFNYPFLMK